MTKAILWFAIGFARARELVQQLGPAIQVAGIVGLSLVQMTIALGLAALTVYKLADLRVSRCSARS